MPGTREASARAPLDRIDHEVRGHDGRSGGRGESGRTDGPLLRAVGQLVRLFDEKAALKAWLAVRQADADSYVFNSQKSTQLNRVTVFKLFRAIAKQAGLGETLQHPHVLKHTAAMLLVPRGECVPDPPSPRAQVVRRPACYRESQ